MFFSCRIRLFFSCSRSPGEEAQAAGADEKRRLQAGSALMIRFAVSPWSLAQAEKKAARRCDTIRASLQVHPSTRHARRAGLAVAGWRSTCWLSITLFSVRCPWPDPSSRSADSDGRAGPKSSISASAIPVLRPMTYGPTGRLQHVGRLTRSAQGHRHRRSDGLEMPNDRATQCGHCRSVVWLVRVFSCSSVVLRLFFSCRVFSCSSVV